MGAMARAPSWTQSLTVWLPAQACNLHQSLSHSRANGKNNHALPSDRTCSLDKHSFSPSSEPGALLSAFPRSIHVAHVTLSHPRFPEEGQRWLAKVTQGASGRALDSLPQTHPDTGVTTLTDSGLNQMKLLVFSLF